VRRRNGVEQLAVTGPVLGVMNEPFGSRKIQLAAGDTLVLTTDGLSEIRNRAGEPLGAGTLALIESAGPRAQQLADDLVKQAKARGGRRLRDDLAILAIRVLETEPDRA